MRTAPSALTICAALAVASLGGCGHAPGAASSAAAWTDGVRFGQMGGAEKAEATYLVGSGRAAALYTIRVRIAKGGRIAPHTHPDTRMLTVVSGEVYYGFGETVDLANAKLYRAGDVLTVPAGKPHWAEASTSAVIYQEAGMGPTAFTPLR